MELSTRPARRNDVFAYPRSVTVYFAIVGIVALLAALVLAVYGNAWGVLLSALFAGVTLGGCAVRFHNGSQVVTHYTEQHPGEPIPTLGWFGVQD